MVKKKESNPIDMSENDCLSPGIVGDYTDMSMSTQVTNNDHLKFLSSLGSSSASGSFVAKVVKRLGSKKKKSRGKSKRTTQDMTQINEANESNDEDAALPINEPIKQQEATQQIAGLSKKEMYLMRPPNNTIILNYGPIPGRQPTVFFSYPAFLKMQRPYKKDRI